MKENQIFISFSSKQTDTAKYMCELLEKNGVNCFISTRDLTAGNEYASQLIDNLDHAKAVLLLLSKASNESPHVLREIEYSVSQKIPIIVYPLEKVELSKSMKYYLMTHQWIPESNDKEGLIISSLKKIISPSTDDGDNNQISTENIANTKEVAHTTLTTEKKDNILFKILIPVCILIIISTIILIFIKSKVSPSIKYTPGDTVVFGTYNDEPIEWRVLKVNDDNSLMLISKYILTLKTYDAAEGGCYNIYDDVNYYLYEYHDVSDEDILIKIRGNNDWTKSNIRTWLNSDKELVNYEDQAPTFQAVGESYYNTESGFLYEFTEQEKNIIMPVTYKIHVNSFNEQAPDSNLDTTDMVYLLSSDELSLFADAGISIYAGPSDKCIETNGTDSNYRFFISAYDTKNYYWWLRDNDGSSVNTAYQVLTELEDGQNIYSSPVGACSYGIRPVVNIRPDKKLITSGN